MLAPTIASSLLLAAAPSPETPAPNLDDRRFELHVMGRGGLRMVGGTGAGGGIDLGLGIRLWQGLYLEAEVGEGVFGQFGSRTSEGTEVGFRHLGEHGDEPEPANADADEATAAASGERSEPLMAGRIDFALRYEIRTPKTTRLRPSVTLGVTHLHEAHWHELLESPGATLAGTGDFVRHRTGVELGAGLRAPFPERWGPAAPHFSARFDLGGAYYFDALPGRAQVSVALGIQAVF